MSRLSVGKQERGLTEHGMPAIVTLKVQGG